MQLHQRNKVQNSEIDPHIHGQLFFFISVKRQCNGERIAFSINGARMIEDIYIYIVCTYVYIYLLE